MHRRRCLLPVLALTLVPLLAAGAEGMEEEFIMTEHMMFLVLQLGLILFAAKAGSLLFSKLKLPGVLGELMSGVLIGPFALGAVHLPGFPHGLFPLPPEGGAVSQALNEKGRAYLMEPRSAEEIFSALTQGIR